MAAVSWGKLPLRLDLGNHSPTGFAWGYLGSGPHQLALAMLADATGDDQLALKLAHFLKEDLICRIDGDCAFSVSAERVREWAAHRYLELHEP